MLSVMFAEGMEGNKKNGEKYLINLTGETANSPDKLLIEKKISYKNVFYKYFFMDKLNLIQGYLNEEGLIFQMPGKKQKKKLNAMLCYLASLFEDEKIYSEAEVNSILNKYHTFNDPATFRRMLFINNLLNRTLDCTKYWLVKHSK